MTPSRETTAAELLAPAGDFETARAAFAAGADAVYCGLADFSARAFAKNFSADELKRLVAYARRPPRPRRVYVTFNTVLDEDRLEDAVRALALLADIGPDALIVQDLGIARLCRRHFPSLPLHASTQLVAHNLEGVLALGELGFTRIVLARELALDEIASIARRAGSLELECFIHGALCYSISGLCLFGAMEKDGRSGNRGTCPYCCRQACGTGPDRTLPFSMKDLRLGEDVRRLAEAGVASLKIEGRMKSPLYVASVTAYYRAILDGTRPSVTRADLETVFSRRTTELYFNGTPSSSPIDPTSLGHLGTEIGSVKRVTKDRDGLAWLRFHTARALERHDGLQFDAVDADGRHFGLGIAEMRPAISRRPVFEVAAGTDVEVRLPDDSPDLAAALRPGTKIYCSMSNAVKRRFPVPSYRPGDDDGPIPLRVELTLAPDAIRARATARTVSVEASVAAHLEPAKCPDKTPDAVRRALARLGDTDYTLADLRIDDPAKLFAPMSLLNDLRRDLVSRLDTALADARARALDAALADAASAVPVESPALKTLKLRVGQIVPPGEWDEIVVLIGERTTEEDLKTYSATSRTIRLATDVYTAEPDFNRLRSAVKRLLRAGFAAWESADLATLRMLRQLGVTDLTADWTLYAFNSAALAAVSELGAKRLVASPENNRENLQYLAESGFAVEFLVQQSTPLFISLTEPAARPDSLSVFRRGNLFVTTRPAPRTFTAPSGVSTRFDLSWDPA